MAKPTFDDLTAPVTQADVFASMVRILGILGVDVTSWRAGSVVRTILASCASVQAAATTVIAGLTQSAFLDTSSGGWLRLIAWYRYGVEARDATPAVGTVDMVNNGTGVYYFDVGDLVLYPISGLQRKYTNTTAFSLGAGATATAVPVQAEILGSAGNLPAHALSTAVAGQPDLVVTQAAAIVGLDAESDPALRDRCKRKSLALSGAGAAEVYDYWARPPQCPALPHGGVVTQTRVDAGATDAHVQVLVASGTHTLDATDLEALRRWLVMTAVPQSVRLSLQQASLDTIDVTVTLWCPAYLDQATAEDRIGPAMVALFADAPIGGWSVGALTNRVFRSAIESAVGVALADPSGVLPRPRYISAVLSGTLDSQGNRLVGADALPVLGVVTVTVLA